MPTLPVLNYKDVVRTFESMGWHFARQQGSHIVMTKEGYIATLSIPAHREVAGNSEGAYSRGKCECFGVL